MSRRARSRLPAILLAPLLLGLLTAAGCSDAGRPNVLLISLDTARRDHFSSYGYGRPTTPRIDAIARDGLRFERCVAVSNWTLPTHASLLTGLFPSTHGAHYVAPDHVHVPHIEPASRLRGDVPTLAEALWAAGYRTAAVVGNWWWLGRRYGLDRGFELYDDRAGEPPLEYRPAGAITDAALEWLAQPDERPFFLFLNYMDPHVPYEPPPPFDQRFARSDERPAGADSASFYRDAQEAAMREGRPLAPELRDFFIDRYDGEIAYADAEIGRLVDRLIETGAYDRTLIVVTADHGEAFGEHAVSGHGFSLYEPELAVPLILKLPGGARRGVVARGVQQTDVLPTAVEILGLDFPGELQGRSLLEQGEDPRGLVAVESARLLAARLRPELGRVQWSLRRGDLKYIELPEGGRELYDLAADPGELHDLAAERGADADALRGALDAWRREIAARGAAPAELPQVDAETARKLRTLGYAE